MNNGHIPARLRSPRSALFCGVKVSLEIGSKLLIGLFLLAILLAGCATSRIDWNTRVGTYTYDQAVLELGPPDKSAELRDGTVVAEWLLSRGYSHSYGFGAYSGYYGPYPPAYVESYSPDYFLRLTFGPDARLKAWTKFYK